MKAEPIVFERVYEAPIAKVWKAITDKNDMKQWYFDLSEFKAEVGFEFTFVGGDDKKSFLHLCKVTEVVSGKKLKHSWRYDGVEGNSFVTWELFEESKNKTRVKLTHEGLETFPQDTSDFAKKNFIGGWTSILGTSLLEYVEVADITKIIEVNISTEQLWSLISTVDSVMNWADAFSPGTKVETDFKIGSVISWIDSTGLLGAKGIVTQNEPNNKLELTYFDDTNFSRPEDLGSYRENYTITTKGTKSILTINAGPLSKKHVKQHEPLWQMCSLGTFSTSTAAQEFLLFIQG
jgi:uncharacterized protein YndB with AHSA1/START domain